MLERVCRVEVNGSSEKKGKESKEYSFRNRCESAEMSKKRGTEEDRCKVMLIHRILVVSLDNSSRRDPRRESSR